MALLGPSCGGAMPMAMPGIMMRLATPGPTSNGAINPDIWGVSSVICYVMRAECVMLRIGHVGSRKLLKLMERQQEH
jgi:hypothetical protein